METVEIIAPPGVRLEDFHSVLSKQEKASLELSWPDDGVTGRLGTEWKIEKVGETLVIADIINGGRLYLRSDRTGEEPLRAAFHLDYSCAELTAEVLEVIVNDPAFMIDDGVGDALPGDEFVREVKRGVRLGR